MGVRVEAVALLHTNHHAKVVVQWRNHQSDEVDTAFRGRLFPWPLFLNAAKKLRRRCTGADARSLSGRRRENGCLAVGAERRGEQLC